MVTPVTAVKALAKLVDWGEVDTPGLGLKRDRWRTCAAKSESTYLKISKPGPPIIPYASYVRAGHFNFVRVLDAGHMINENRPEEAKHLFETWVLNRGAFAECSP